MLANEYDTMRRVEDSYWWYAVLRGAVLREMRRLTEGNPQARILDAGCGTGGMLARLKAGNPAWRLSGIDFSQAAVEHTRARGLEDVRAGDVCQLPSADGAFDGIVSLDVLYHRNVDEARAVAEFYRALRPGGFLVLNFPAFDFLAGSHDIVVSGVRRYTRERVRAALAQAGFQIERQQYWNAWLFPILCVWRPLSRILSWRKGPKEREGDLATLPGWMNSALAALGRADFALCRMLALPFGTSVFAVARKPAAI